MEFKEFRCRVLSLPREPEKQKLEPGCKKRVSIGNSELKKIFEYGCLEKRKLELYDPKKLVELKWSSGKKIVKNCFKVRLKIQNILKDRCVEIPVTFD